MVDYLVIGSGCSGAIAAETLVRRGATVTMLDVGATPDEPIDIPNKSFLDLRRTDPDQYRYLIGEQASGVFWGKVGKGEQLTPPRQHIMKGVDEYIPVASDSFSPLESLGYGGLGIGWGLQCWQYSEADLKSAGLPVAAMRKAYQYVADRVGISATADDAADYTIGSLKDYQPSPAMDRNHRYIYKKYLAQKAHFNQAGFHMGRTPLALITKDTAGRKKYAYRDMDFYSDNDSSAWRPWITVNQLRKQRNFTYIDNHLVLSFAEKKDHVEVRCLQLPTNRLVTITCRKLILASSALGSARIVLRSLGQTNTKLPLLCNPYSYVPCLQPRFVGRAAETKKLGFTQLSLFFDPENQNANTSVASLYSYQSLMLFRIIRHVPLDFRDAKILMRYLMSGIVIMGIHHADNITPQKYLQLQPARTLTGDNLRIAYSLSEQEKRLHDQRERALIKTMRKLGTYGLKRMDPGYGSSIHYAGTLPLSKTDKPFSLDATGRLHGTRHVYVADSSGFTYLPAPGLTFSLMANAHLVAESVLKNG
ncbi:MAG TPA: GMC oxidoreductase [Candidatus Saccharimonadales bacterium]|nr:GMC oxidoreductase [Candidatus Saccharimonadales bacterium]